MVRPANRTISRHSDGSLPECWPLPERPSAATDYWLPTSPAGIRLQDLTRIATIHWRIEHDYRELTDGLGPDHLKGRSWIGWHRHLTLPSLAQAIRIQLRRTPHQ